MKSLLRKLHVAVNGIGQLTKDGACIEEFAQRGSPYGKSVFTAHCKTGQHEYGVNRMIMPSP